MDVYEIICEKELSLLGDLRSEKLKEVGTSNNKERGAPASAALRKYSSSSLMISTRSFPLVETTIASSLVVEVAIVSSFENPLTTDGGAAMLAAPAVVVVVTATSDTTVVSSHSSSVTDLDEDGMKGSQKSQLDECGGGGGGGGGRTEELVVVEAVHVSEMGLIGIGGGDGSGGGGGGVGGGIGGRWW